MEFIKKILAPGKYNIKTPAGERKLHEIPQSRLQAWADKSKKMMAAGLRIPAPWRHDDSKPSAEVKGKKKASSKDNAGWWKDFWINEADGSLYGKLDVPLEADAAKVGTTVTEVSPLVLPEFTDGNNNKWEDALMHVALVTHPVIPGQDNFQAVPAEAMALCLGDLLEALPVELADDPTKKKVKKAEKPVPESSNEPDGEEDDALDADEDTDNKPPVVSNSYSLQDALQILAQVGLTLPQDTQPENMIERICVAGTALAAANNPPQDEQEPKEQPSPVVMSYELDPNGKVSKSLLSFAQKTAKKTYADRISGLINSGRISKVYADKTLNPMLDGFELSLNEEGEAEKGNLDVVLEALENQPANTSFTGTNVTSRKKTIKVAGVELAHEEEMPPELLTKDNDLSGGNMTEEDINKIVENQMVSSGRRPAIVG